MIKNSIMQDGQVLFDFPVIQDRSKPCIEIHKNGPYLLFKPLDPIAADILHSLKERAGISAFNNTNYWGIPGDLVYLDAEETTLNKIELWRHLKGDVTKHPLCQFLKINGVEVGVVPTLENYIRKEVRRQEREDTPFPTPSRDVTNTLFERASIGTNLKCSKNYADAGDPSRIIFEKGKRYMVVSSIGNGEDAIKIGVTPISKDAVIKDDDNAFKWSSFHPEMEEFFDDSDEEEAKLTVDMKYPELVAAMRKRVDKMGYPLFEHNAIDACMEALKRGVLNCKPMRMGKAQPLDAKLLTPAGWATMGDIQTGDYVFGKDGLSHKVIGTFPQGKKDVYKVTFSDGSSTECCGEHLWEVYTSEWKYKKQGSKVFELNKIKDNLKFPNGNTRYYIPLVQPIQFSNRDLPLDPYLIGCLLGDGSLSLNSKGYGTIAFSTADQELLEYVAKLVPSGIIPNKHGKYNYELTIPKANGHQFNPLRIILDELNIRHRAESKYIPDIYKFSSVNQRQELLRGLLDTDGSVSIQKSLNSASAVTYSSVSERLCDDVLFLVQSLGGIATKNSRPTYYIKDGTKIACQTSYKLTINFGGTWIPFKLKRKADKYKPSTKFIPSRGIISAEFIGTKECKCISIDAKDSLYVTDHCILTHNTRESITLVNLWGSEKIAIFGSQNVRLAWEKEFKKIGITNFVMVDKLSDLDKPGRFYLMKYGWIRQKTDSSKKERKEHTNYLKPSQRKYSRKVAWSTYKPETIIVYQHNSCPHCKGPLEKPVLKRDESGSISGVGWERSNGYMCRNKECVWTTSNKGKKGAAWSSNKIITHKGGTYIDWGLAAHVNCPEDSIKGRFCTSCKQADSVWIPQVTKRFKKKFSCIIPDEIHNIKDVTTLTAEAIYRMKSRRKIGPTGTLLSNSAMDAYWIMWWVIGGPRDSFPYRHMSGRAKFEQRFCDHAILEKPTGQVDPETNQIIKKTVSKRLPYLKNAPDWWQFAAPKIIRRNYSDKLYLASLEKAGVFKPNVKTIVLKVPMVPKQITLMIEALKNFKTIYEQAKKEADSKQQEMNKTFIMSQMTAMRVIATVPQFINKRFNQNVYDGVPGGGKAYHITNLAKDRIQGGGKVLILSDFIEMQDCITAELKSLGVIKFDTSWDDDERREVLQRFEDDPTLTGLVAGPKAVSEALDFSWADTCICCDVLWSPATQCQAWSRILAPIPRERDCEIFIVLSDNSIDEHMYNVFYSKLQMAEQAMDHRTINRRALEINYQWFAERVIQEEANLVLQLQARTIDDDSINLVVVDDGDWEERV
jgi:hypothetical protein